MLIMTIDATFNDLWHVTRQRPLRQRVLVYWAIITLGPVAGGASIWATAYVMRESYSVIEHATGWGHFLMGLTPLVLTCISFSALFVLVPNRRIEWRDAFVGGACTALMLEWMKAGFTYYITQFPTYTVIYGAFATLPIFLLWLYLSWLAILLGATITACLPLIRLGRWEMNRYPGAIYLDALHVLRHLKEAQTSAPQGLSNNQLAKQLHLHYDELGQVLRGLEQLNLISRTHKQRWILCCDPQTTRLGSVFDYFLLDRHQPYLTSNPALLGLTKALIETDSPLSIADLVHLDLDLALYPDALADKPN